MPPKDRAWQLTKATETDLEKIWLYTAGRWSENQADQYHREMMETIADLASARKQGRKMEHISPTYLYRSCGSHTIFFREEKTRIVVVRILHNRMDFRRHL